MSYVMNARHLLIQIAFRVVIRGDQEDEAVLCSQTATYEMKVVDLSNTMLICPGLSTLDDESESSILKHLWMVIILC